MQNPVGDYTSRQISRSGLGAYLLLGGVLVGALSGCAERNMTTGSRDAVFHAPPMPETRLTDYLAMRCQDLLQLHSDEADENPLYWTRFMDCARQLNNGEARLSAARWHDGNWQDSFRMGILLSQAQPTATERQHYSGLLDSTSADIPPQVRPLYNLWLDRDQLARQLAEQASRYEQLQISSNRDLDALRQQQQQLRQELSVTTRKLENLTDIERQLSTRKAGGGYVPETSQGHAVGKSHTESEPRKPATEEESQ